MRALPIGLMVLGLIGIPLVGVTSPAVPVNKVVVGVLDFETSGVVVGSPEERKNLLMKDLRRNARVKLVDIGESCGLSDLKRHGYERAERYKHMYQLDMILHTHLILPIGTQTTWHAYFSLIDLHTKRVKEASIETVGMPIEHGFRGISRKLLVSQDLNRVLTAKKEASKKKRVLPPESLKRVPRRSNEGRKS